MSQFMKAGDPVRVVAYDAAWPAVFQQFIWKVIAQADKWAQQTGWVPTLLHVLYHYRISVEFECKTRNQQC